MQEKTYTSAEMRVLMHEKFVRDAREIAQSLTQKKPIFTLRESHTLHSSYV